MSRFLEFSVISATVASSTSSEILINPASSKILNATSSFVASFITAICDPSGISSTELYFSEYSPIPVYIPYGFTIARSDPLLSL